MNSSQFFASVQASQNHISYYLRDLSGRTRLWAMACIQLNHPHLLIARLSLQDLNFVPLEVCREHLISSTENKGTWNGFIGRG